MTSLLACDVCNNWGAIFQTLIKEQTMIAKHPLIVHRVRKVPRQFSCHLQADERQSMLSNVSGFQVRKMESHQSCSDVFDHLAFKVDRVEVLAGNTMLGF